MRRSSLAVFLAASVLLLSGCASSTSSFHPSGCELIAEGVCLSPLYAYMPPPIDHPVLRLAVIPASEYSPSSLPQSLQEEIRAKTEMAALHLKASAPRLEIVERRRIDVALRELEFQASGHVRDDQFVGVGRMLGADHVLTYQVTVHFTRDVSTSMPLYPSDATEFGLKGGMIRAFTHGKVIRVQTGTVVFQQTSERYVVWPPPPTGTYGRREQLEDARFGLAGQTLGGLFMALHAALLPASDGSFISSEQDSNRVKVDYVLIGSPAHDAGLREGDIITAVDGIPVRGIGDRVLRDLDMTPRELFHYTIQRKGQEQTLAVRPKLPAWMRAPVVGNESSSPSGPWEKYQPSPAKP